MPSQQDPPPGYKTDHDLLIEVNALMRSMSDDFKEAKTNFVTKAEFWPVKALVFGCTGLMLTSLMTAIIFLALHRV